MTSPAVATDDSDGWEVIDDLQSEDDTATWASSHDEWSPDTLSPDEDVKIEPPTSDTDITQASSGGVLSKLVLLAVKRPRTDQFDHYHTVAQPDELYPCLSCSSYHYIHTCVYLLDRPEWQDYCAKYLWPRVPGETSNTKVLNRQTWWNHPNQVKKDQGPQYLGDAGLVASRMSRSAAGIFIEDEKWRAQLKDKGDKEATTLYLAQNIETQQMLAWQEQFDWEERGAESDDEDDAGQYLEATEMINQEDEEDGADNEEKSEAGALLDGCNAAERHAIEMGWHRCG